MGDYRRYVSYLFCYEKGIKKNSVGFVRIEIRDGQGKMLIHLQDKSVVNENFPIYAVRWEGEDMQPVSLGIISVKNGKGEAVISFLPQSLGESGIPLLEFGGMLIYPSKDYYYGTEWADRPLIFRNILPEKTENEKEQEDEKDIQDLKTTALEGAQIETGVEIIKKNEIKEEIKVKTQKIKECESESTKEWNAFKPYTLSELYKRFGYRPCCRFMLHGHYRFGHLGVLEKGERYIIGVPGIFCKREQMIAKEAGFPNFYPKKPGTLSYGDFGYWYTNVEYLK